MPAPWNRAWIAWLGALVIVGAIALTYSNTLRVPLLLDDPDSITDNASIRHLGTSWHPQTGSGLTVSGRPVLNFTLAVNYAISGFDLPGFHIGNLVIHALAALTLFGIIRLTLQQTLLAPRFGSHATLPAFFIAVLWSLHPLQTESVTYIIQRAESLVGLFYLLTLYGFIRSTESSGSRLWPVITVICCLIGMACKEVMASAPIIVFAYDAIFVSGSWKNAWQRRRRLHLALACTWLLLGALVLSTSGRGGSVGFSAHISWWQYALTQTTAIIRYLRLVFWPSELIFDYGSFVQKDPLRLALGSLGIVALLAATVFAIQRKPAAGFAGLWFFLILAPSSSVIPVVTQTIAEHRMYLPLAAAIALPVLILWQFRRSAVLIALLSLSVLAACVTHLRNQTYGSMIDLWQDTLAKCPHDRAYSHLGVALVKADRIDESIACHEKAISLNPKDPKNFCNLGLSYSKAGRNAEALVALEHAIRLGPREAVIHINYGNALFTAGRFNESIAELELALKLRPDNGEAHFNLANTLSAVGRTVEACQHYEAALEANPRDIEAMTNLGSELSHLGKPGEAIRLYERALRINPDSGRTHSNFGIALMLTKQPEAALEHFREAVRLVPNLPQARLNLGSALAEIGQRQEAITQFEALLILAPPTAEICNNLGVLYAQTERYTTAGEYFKKAVALDPNYPGAKENLARLEAYLSARR